MSAPLILGTNSIKDVGYNVDNSLRFNGGSSDDLERTPSSSGNNNKNTLSVWIKRSKVDEEDFIIYGDNGSANRCKITFLPSGKLQINTIVSASNNLVYETNRLFRDVSAWYHIVIAFDSTLATAGDRCRLYVNGVEETSFSNETDMGQNTSNFLSTASATIYIGSQSTGNYYDGYMAEFCFIDGQQLDPTSFGEFDEDSGIWKPIDVSGLTFGTNGFYLDFEDSSALGNDVSGNNNDFTVNNLTSIDQSTDTCTNNYATFNSILNNRTGTLSEGNLKAVTTNSNNSPEFSTIGISQGKWYAEFKYTAQSSGSALMIGITQDASEDSRNDKYPGESSISYGYNSANGETFNNNSGSTYGNSFAVGDIIGIALDLDNHKLYFSKNGTFQNSGDPTSGATGTGAISISSTPQSGFYFIGAGDTTTNYNVTFEANFGNPPFSITSGNSDGNGYGNFEYSVPSGYYALNTKNLAEYG